MNNILATALIVTAFSFSSALAQTASPTRPPADISFTGPNGKPVKISTLRGLSFVLILAEEPNERAFKKQVQLIEERYSEFAARKVVFLAGFPESPETPEVKTNVPFAVLNNAALAAQEFAMSEEDDFLLLVIGPTGEILARSEIPRDYDWLMPTL